MALPRGHPSPAGFRTVRVRAPVARPLLNRSGMTKQLTLLVSLLGALGAVTEARADVASDRVLLITGSTFGCTGGTGFKRLKQSPDGTSTTETAEFQVPEGTYLEITSVEYTTPYHTLWASFYVQSIDLNIRNRSSAASASVLSARYHNSATYGDNGDGYVDIGQLVSPGARTQVAAFPAGPLMSSAARLCLNVTTNFWTFGGAVRVRGRLIPTGQPVIEPPPPIGTRQP